MTPTHFVARLHARGRLPAVTIHGPIVDRLLHPLASASSTAAGWMRGRWAGHRTRSHGSELVRIRHALLTGHETECPAFVATPLAGAEHAARFPDEAETPMEGGYPVALLANPSPATVALMGKMFPKTSTGA